MCLSGREHCGEEIDDPGRLLLGRPRSDYCSRVPKVALILGAGFSRVAGLPVTSELMDGEVWRTSLELDRRVDLVLNAWVEWSALHGKDVPAFLHAAFQGQVTDPTVGLLPDVRLPWHWVAQYLAIRLSEHTTGARGGGSPQYYERITTPSHVEPHIQLLRSSAAKSEIVGVVVTNYDLLAERALRHRPIRRWPVPGFYYAGLPHPQLARGTRAPWRDRPDHAAEVELSGKVPLCKLHGSLNWTELIVSPYRDTDVQVSIWQDLRSNYRLDAYPAIVAPIPELAPSSWLRPVWIQAERILKDAEHWIVVGYSLPAYDIAIRQLLVRASERLQSVEVRDPLSAEIATRFRSLLPGAEVEPGPGI
jgi:hypothetical protein